VKPLDGARKYLNDLDRFELSGLLEHASYRVVPDQEFWGEDYIEISSPTPLAEAIAGLPDFERVRVIEAIQHADADAADIPKVGSRLVSRRTSADTDALPVKATALAEVVLQRQVMINVSTNRQSIKDVNDGYRARRRRIRELLEPLGLEDPSPFDYLWDWYHRWKDGLPDYKSRRQFAYQMYRPLISQLLVAATMPVPSREPTGWERVDRGTARARVALDRAATAEDFQTVGLLCREILISLAQAVYDPARHQTPDGVVPSETDARRMLEAFLAATVQGDSFETVRAHAKASLRLALDLQHRRTADFRLAALCLEATSSTVNVIAILGGQRDSNS